MPSGYQCPPTHRLGSTVFHTLSSPEPCTLMLRSRVPFTVMLTVTGAHGLWSARAPEGLSVPIIRVNPFNNLRQTHPTGSGCQNGILTQIQPPCFLIVTGPLCLWTGVGGLAKRGGFRPPGDSWPCGRRFRLRRVPLLTSPMSPGRPPHNRNVQPQRSAVLRWGDPACTPQLEIPTRQCKHHQLSLSPLDPGPLHRGREGQLLPAPSMWHPARC